MTDGDPPRRGRASPLARCLPADAASMPDSDALRTAGWIGALFALEILLQRFAVPGRPVALLLPVLLVWVVLAWRARIVEIDGRRLGLWCIATASTGVIMLVETALMPGPLISTDSWMLFMTVWLAAVVRLRDRRLTTYVLTLRRVVSVVMVLAAACIVMMTSQLVGLAYRDYLALWVPETLLLSGFVITYPVEFGSSVFRANAWIGLEPSIVSYQIGLGLLAAILVRAPWWHLLLLTVGMFTVFAGSGFFVVIFGVLAMLVFPVRQRLLRYVLPAAAIGIVAFFTPMVSSLVERSSYEFTDDGSSFSSRAVQPYVQLWPRWVGDELGILLGRGAGAAQRYADDLGIVNLLTPTPARILFDYGLVAGFIVIVVLLFFYLDGPSASIAFTSFVSLWALQPGGSQVVFALPLLALVTFFAPRAGLRIEEVGIPPSQYR